MEPIIIHIDADLKQSSLREIAGHYERLARMYRARAAELDGYDAVAKRSAARLDRLANTPAVLDGYLDNGLSFETALEAAEAETGIPAQTFALYWKKRKRTQDAAVIAKRAQMVCVLTRQGKTQAEIATHLGIHKNSVSRILSRMTGNRSVSGP